MGAERIKTTETGSAAFASGKANRLGLIIVRSRVNPTNP